MKMEDETVSDWRPFYWDSNLRFCWVRSAEDWRSIVMTYVEEEFETSDPRPRNLEAVEARLLGARSSSRASYGLRREHTGEATLRDYFQEHGMEPLFPAVAS